jgi:hypothetical protein
MDRELLDAGEMARHLVPAGSVFAFLAEHRWELFPDSFTADLFPSRTGRPSLPADLGRPCRSCFMIVASSGVNHDRGQFGPDTATFWP